jgi:hypothetical protein
MILFSYSFLCEEIISIATTNHAAHDYRKECLCLTFNLCNNYSTTQTESGGVLY